MSFLDNPWLALPAEPPYVLPADAPQLDEYHKARNPSDTAYRLHLLPLPFQGCPGAPIVLLGLNPGYAKSDEVLQTTPYFRDANFRNYRHDPTLPYPLFFLDPQIEGGAPGAGQQWWYRRLKALREQYNDDRLLARAILSVQYVPYRSKIYKHSRKGPASQQYGFELVRQAVVWGAVVVALRSGRLWQAAVPELNGYARFYQLSNPRNPVVSQQQFKANPAGWPAVEAELNKLQQASAS